jgi:FMN phosphatase YigB (HAD superfamily)
VTIRAVLFDVGGTLFDDLPDETDPLRLSRLREILGPATWHGELLAEAIEALVYDRTTFAQDIRGAIRAVLERNRVLASDELVERVRAACCTPLVESGRPRPGAVAALRFAKDRGLRVAIVTNVLWRTRTEVLADWKSLGFTDIDAIATSLEIGRFKPHPAMFQHALAALAVAPPDAVMVGNSREADVDGAKRLGLRAIWVRSRETSTGRHAPDATVDEMTGVPTVLSRWL